MASSKANRVAYVEDAPLFAGDVEESPLLRASRSAAAERRKTSPSSKPEQSQERHGHSGRCSRVVEVRKHLDEADDRAIVPPATAAFAACCSTA